VAGGLRRWLGIPSLGGVSDDGFLVEVDDATIRRARAKARELRASPWWKRRIAPGVCHYCSAQVGAKALTMDHLVPIIRGGVSTKGNVVPACKACNNAKKYKLPFEFDR
jgi:5-methylcytosine-specific restriction endonuclease McrA